jgi:asparagine synthase (glutamine-hydrolysing)
MCAIVGTVRFDLCDIPVDRRLLERMRDRMAHRGPDGAGIWLSPDSRIGLAHRRLAIIDLDERANQPMSTIDGRYTLVFNGEIYNHKELRIELRECGVVDWRTSHSDTEVLLYAYRQWGVDCLPRLHGMFAFAIWDEQNKELWCARDRVGVKPLYYSVLGDRMNFASEIKALVLDPVQPRALDEQALFDYLSFMTVPPPRTMFKGISKLAGGCWLRVGLDGVVKTERYWDAMDEAQRARKHPPRDLERGVRDGFAAAVRYRSVADVDVGVFLSGGIDSSLNAALFASEQTSAIKTFTIGYQGETGGYRNEVEHARVMADFVGAQHHESLLSVDDLVRFLPRMIELQDEPIGDPVCVPLYYVSKLARDSAVTVTQVGEGADELFYGYPRWHHVIALHRVLDYLPRMAQRIALFALAALGREHGYLAETLRRRALGQVPFWGGAECFTRTEKERLLSARLRRKFEGRSSWDALAEIRQRFCDKTTEQDLPTWMTYVDLNLRLPELLLMRVDKMSMGASLECRVPFLDHEFIGRILAIPTRRRLSLFRKKHILKRVARKLIPQQVIDRKKQGFGVPVADWLRGPLLQLLTDEIRHFVGATDVLDSDGVEEILAAGNDGHIWWLYNVAAWHRMFIEEPYGER